MWASERFLVAGAVIVMAMYAMIAAATYQGKGWWLGPIGPATATVRQAILSLADVALCVGQAQVCDVLGPDLNSRP